MHSTQNSEKWELEIYYNLVLNLLVGQIYEIELWIVGQWQWLSFSAADCSKIFKLKIEACPVHAGFYFKHNIHLQPIWSPPHSLGANFGWDKFIIMPELISKLLLISILSHCAVQLESEQSPFAEAGQSQSMICCIVQDLICNMPVPYFDSKLWMIQSEVKRWALL